MVVKGRQFSALRIATIAALTVAIGEDGVAAERRDRSPGRPMLRIYHIEDYPRQHFRISDHPDYKPAKTWKPDYSIPDKKTLKRKIFEAFEKFLKKRGRMKK